MQYIIPPPEKGLVQGPRSYQRHLPCPHYKVSVSLGIMGFPVSTLSRLISLQPPFQTKQAFFHIY